MVQLCKKLLTQIGLNPSRLRMEALSAGEGIRFAEVINDFSKSLRELGPLGKAEGIAEDDLNSRLIAVKELVPYIRLVERERFRVRFSAVEEYEAFFRSDEVDRLFKELIADKLAIGRILALLRAKPCSTGEISSALGLAPSETSKYLSATAKQGLARFDENQKRYVPV
jgi:F420-non-reducing hydrogenase iron-sulfur subunit